MLRIHALTLIAILLAGCATSPPPPLLHDKIRVTQTSQVDEVEGAEPAATPLKAAAPTSADIFAGNDRRDPKTSVATGGLKSFSSHRGATLLLPDRHFYEGLRDYAGAGLRACDRRAVQRQR